MSKEKCFLVKFKEKSSTRNFLPFLNQRPYVAEENSGIFTVYIASIDEIGLRDVQHLKYSTKAFNSIFEIVTRPGETI